MWYIYFSPYGVGRILTYIVMWSDMQNARYAFFVALSVFCAFLDISSAHATGYFFYERESESAQVIHEHYHTPESYACIIEDKPSALGVGNRISDGDIRSREYNKILESYTFSRDVDIIDSIHVAYAFYVIAEIIGDREGKKRQFWLARHIRPVVRQRITEAIYAKYSPEYLQKCFSRHAEAKSQQINILDVYPLYMD